MCSYVQGTNDTEADIVAFHTQQSAGGHHLIVYTVDHPITLAPHQCPQGGQPGWSQLLASQDKTEDITFPAGVGFHVKAHQQYAIETHYINSTSAPIQVHDQFSTKIGQPGTVQQHAGVYFFGTTNIDIAPQSQATATVSCPVPQAMGIHTMFGHEHKMGVGVNVTHVAADGSSTPLYSTTQWDGPPITKFDPGLSLDTTDTIQVKCDWNNTGDTRLRYPHEMCFGIGYYWPATGGLNCTSGGRQDTCHCLASGAVDTGPGGSTVEVHVTRADTIQGAGGDIDKGAPIYCALFKASDWMGLQPKPGAKPYYFDNAVDQPLTTTTDEVVLSMQDVTPGDYEVTCFMDTIGGGFSTGTGDVVNIKPGAVTATEGQTAITKVNLNFALP